MNNAGVDAGVMSLREQAAQNWDRVHGIDIKGVFLGKAGVIHMTRSPRLIIHHTIRANSVCPGAIWTGMAEAAKGSAEPPPGTPVLPGILMNGWGLVREIANAALFLASDEASVVIGVTLPVDRGYAIGFSGMGADTSAGASG